MLPEGSPHNRQAATLHRIALITFITCLLVEVAAVASTQFLPETETVMTVAGLAMMLGFLGFWVGFIVSIVALTKTKPKRWVYLVTVALNGLFSLGACCFTALAAFMDGWNSG